MNFMDCANDPLSSSVASMSASKQQLYKISLNSSSCNFNAGAEGINNYSVRSSLFIQNENEATIMEVDEPKLKITKKHIFELESKSKTKDKEN